MASINTRIAPSNAEAVRDLIGAILAVELANQFTLAQQSPVDTTIPERPTVWVERCIPFDGRTAMPAINVCISKTDFSEQTQRALAGGTMYDVDVYTGGNPDPLTGVGGDEAAMKKMSRLAFIIARILSAPVYRTLTIATGAIGGVTIVGYTVLDKETAKNALNNVVGRIQVYVRATEETIITDTPVPLLQATTLINAPNEGMYYDFIPPTP